MKRIIIASILNLILSLCQTQDRALAAGIGSWNAYMAYHDITDIRPAGNIVYVLSSGSLFSYNADDGEVSVYNKVNSLSDCTINHIAWNTNVGKLIIVYDNYNIDLIDNSGNVTNLSDYHTKTVNLDKTVNGIYVNGKFAYLYTNFGILKINMGSAEISDTYILNMKITACAIAGGRIYAQTPVGIYGADMSVNLLDRNNWHHDSSVTVDIFRSDDALETTKKHGYTERRIFDRRNGCWWSNQEDGRLQSYTEAEDGTQTITRSGINPVGPKYNYFYSLKYANGTLYSCGGVFESAVDMNYPGTVQTLDNGGTWNVYQDGLDKITGYTYKDVDCIDYDPTDPRRVFAGGRTGLYEFYDGKLVNYFNKDNSPLKPAMTETVGELDNNYVIVNGIKFDAGGNLWVTNSECRGHALMVYKKDGTWETKDHPELLYKSNSHKNMCSLMFDSRGLLWFVANNWDYPALICYDTANDAVNVYSQFVNQDGSKLTVEAISCVTEDNERNIWIGTDKGPLYLTDSDITSGNKTFTQFKVPRNDGTDYADYLLSNINIKSICVDGGNRKWFGTESNGVYLISSDNLTQEQHFTTVNSDILSDNILSIAYNGTNGEVFIGTGKGLCSYMSDATAPNEDMTKDNVYAYPNPVRPEYTGYITIVGLTLNADVKIMDSSGRIVAEGTSTGGMFKWDGKDLNGNRVASGVYMVGTATNEGKKGTVCKIAVIR